MSRWPNLGVHMALSSSGGRARRPLHECHIEVPQRRRQGAAGLHERPVGVPQQWRQGAAEEVAPAEQEMRVTGWDQAVRRGMQEPMGSYFALRHPLDTK